MNDTLVGPIHPSDEFALLIGFTDNRFSGYIYANESTVWLSVIMALTPRCGHFSQFLDGLLSHGFEVKVPTPSQLMQAIIEKRGFTKSVGKNDLMEFEVWTSPAKEVNPLITESVQELQSGEK